ncbi:hypothetical protein K1719_038294 [Acacia pycnantha]|nr:hypothetical protein K1719_038294 [Acacia pycnantha]
MMERMSEKWKGLMRERWVVFVCSMWVQSFAGMAYMFGAISPAIKATMGYNQKQLAVLAVAKDLGDNIGFVAGKLSQVSSISRVLIVGALQNFAGYLLLWLVITHKIPSMPLWALCICIFVGNNAATYYNTATLVSCVKNFPQNRGPVVGILKGFVGLSGAIMTQIVAIFSSTPDEASLIFIIAVGPSMVSLCLSFFIRPIHGHHQQATRPSHGSSFLFIYCVCLLLASYLMGVLMLQNKMNLNQSTIKLFGIILIILILLPIIVPIYLVFFSKPNTPDEEETLLVNPATSAYENETGVGEDTEENRGSSVAERPRQIVQLEAKIFQALTEAVKKVKHKNGPQIGEDFTLIQALVKPEFWLVFFALVMGSGTGLTIINNMGQICQSLGDNNATVYVSMISIFNFLGRVGGGYFSEVIVRKFAYPRLAALAAVQAMMIVGVSYYAMGWGGQLYVVTILTGLGYGAHWAIGPATASELFGLKNFGAIYNFYTLATPTGSLILSGLVSSTLYDYYAEQQQQGGAKAKNGNELLVCEGNICYSVTCVVLAGACLLGIVLSLTVVRRTKKVYARLYGKSLLT